MGTIVVASSQILELLCIQLSEREQCAIRSWLPETKDYGF